MSKNMTRKGLAFGATFALGAGLISGAPAVAAGTQDGSVTLLPNVGAEYVVRSGDVFDLKANYDASLTASSRFLKFLVEDAGSDTKFDVDGNGATADPAVAAITISDGDWDTTGGTTENQLTITIPAGSGIAVDDVLTINSSNNDLDGTYTVRAAVTGDTVWRLESLVITDNTAADANNTTGTITATDSSNGLSSRADLVARTFGSPAVRGGYSHDDQRSTFGYYVVGGVDNSVANDQILRLISTDSSNSVAVNVTAWIDNNGNDEIDATEKASATRTVSFLKASDITATTTIRPATAGESTVTADVVTSPVLNGLMILAAANENLTVSTVTSALALVKFTRQGDSAVVTGATNGTYSNTTKKWTFTSLGFDNSGWTDTHASKPAAKVSDDANADDLDAYSITSNVATLVMEADHGYRVGDTVTVNAAENRLDVTTAKITAVPTSKSFSYAVATANKGADIALTDVAEADVLTVGVLLRNKVEAGLITAQFFMDNTNGATASSTPVSPIASYSVGAKVVGTSGLAIEGVPTATVNAAGKVAKGATTADFVVTVKDADGDAVGAGVDVTLTAQRTAGTSTITANGLAVGSTAATTFYGKTDANGEVKISLTNSAGVVGDSVALTADSQGATQATLSAVWEDKVYTIHDINDANYDNSVRTRSVLAGASYPITFLVQDQWKAVAGADVRLKVSLSGRTVQTSIVELTNGLGSLTVVDGGLTTGDTTITVVGQKKSAVTGLWADTDASFADWDGAGGIDLAAVTLKYQTASAINFNANGANFPSTTAADYTADVTTLTPVALDQRVSNTAAPAFKAAEKAVVSGSVTLANGVVATGSLVTVSGAGLAFKAGNVWALDSISFVTDGTFAVEVYSRTSGAKTVTVTSGAATKTQTVTFNAVAAAKGYSVVLNTPASVQRGSTMKIEGQILDANGNGIPLLTAGTGANATLQVSYLGLGLVSGVLPTTTDKDGKFFFYVLVGTNDVGTATVTASYDADGTGTASAAAAISKTIYVGQSAPSDSKVNAGSFKGYVAIYAKGYAGDRLSAKVGNDWVVVASLASDFERVVEFTGAGYTINVPIYINRVLVDTITVTTK